MNIYQDMFMPSHNYIKKMFVPIDAGRVAGQTKYFENKKDIKGLTGVVVSYDMDIVRKECRQVSGTNILSWLEVYAPANELLLDLDIPLIKQSPAVQSYIFEKTGLSLLFKDESYKILDRINESILENEKSDNPKAIADSELHIWYERKRQELISIGTGGAYIDFLNNRNVEKNPEQTVAYLYRQGIKGIKFKDDQGDRILVFNARDDIEVKDIYRSIEA